MKISRITFCFAVILSFCAFTFAADILHPVAYWNFDEESGTTAIDSVGLNNGTLMNGATRTAGKFGNAIQFDGTTGYVEISDANDTAIEFNKNSSFTLSLWINPQESPQAGYFISKMRANRQGGVFGYWVGYGSSTLGSHLNFTVESSYGSSSSAITPVDTAPVEHWYNVICVYDNTQMKVYVNGQLQAENTFTYNGGLAYPDKNLIIGAWGVDSSILQFFKGLIDDVRIYNYALNADEVTQLYQLEPTTENDIDHPVAHWKFDEGSGTIANDSAGDSNGNLMNGPVWTTGQIGGALSFDGRNDYIVAADNASQQIKTNQITVSAWIKLAANIGNTQRRIVCKQQNNNIAWGMEIFGAGYEGSTGNQLAFHDSSGTTFRNCISQTHLMLNTWYYVTVTDNAGKIRIYINGILDKAGDDGYGIPEQIAAPITIGRTNPESLFFFNGVIDDVRIYNFALNADEIATLYDEGSPDLQSISISGPVTVAEESKTQYQVIGNFNDGSTEDITADVNLTIVRGGDYAGIDANGLLTTDRIYRPAESCTIQADYPPLSASKEVLISSVCDGNQCTERQLLQRNLNDTVKIKQDIIKELNRALKIEKLTSRLTMLTPAKSRQERNKLVQINIKLLAAITEELWARKQINESVGSLEEALEILNTRQILQKSK